MTEVSEDDDGEDDGFVDFSIIRFLFYLLKKENINYSYKLTQALFL
jgi:hypothetical protein